MIVSSAWHSVLDALAAPVLLKRLEVYVHSHVFPREENNDRYSPWIGHIFVAKIPTSSEGSVL